MTKSQPDGACGAKTRAGTPCKRPVGRGALRCDLHGGRSPQALAKAAQRVATMEAAEQVKALGLRVDIDPGTALLDLVHWTAGEVAYWRARVAEIEENDLTWGVTKVKDGGDDRGTTKEAKPNIAYVMLERASDRLASYATAALKAGVEERRVRLAESQGLLIADVIRAILQRLDLSPDQQLLVGSVVPEELRRLAPKESA